ncbi:ribosome biogenesis protein NOP53 [Spea bombifrons]|uniref:ribosome biogenesis protein NOP53 n=1 Tax=Spea bombifrons TaxID=233779 RepID=UPI0023499689|nr:ribosome biogenesis protein NOP53 [Spea bombifrons]
MAAPGGRNVGRSDFLGFTPGAKGGQTGQQKRKRLNRNKKKTWKRHSDVRDVEEFLDDVRLQERTAGGLLAEKTDDSLFFLDTGEQEKDVAPRKKTRPLRIDLILQPDSKVPAPKDITSHQVPNGRKLKLKHEREAKLEAKGILPRPEKLLRAQLRNKRPRCIEEPNNNPARAFYDLWGEQNPLDAPLEGKDSWYLQQTRKSRVKRPDRLNAKPSQLPAVEIASSGASYNPTFESHQALLLQAHEDEVKRLREEEKVERQLNLPTAAEAATQESQFQELCEGLVEESEDEQVQEEQAGAGLGTMSLAQRERKTERQRKKEKEAKRLRARLEAEKCLRLRTQGLYQLRSIRSDLARRQAELTRRKKLREAKRKAAAFKPKRLGRLKYQEEAVQVKLSDELPGTLRRLKPEGSIAKDRFKSFQKRNLIEPRERAKFKRRLKVKYVEKRAFREVTL